jgi:hypothetical protein
MREKLELSYLKKVEIVKFVKKPDKPEVFLRILREVTIATKNLKR